AGTASLAEADSRPDQLYPTVRAISGRKDECLLTPDGGRLPSLNFYSLLQTHTDILRFQFIQTDLNNVTMKICCRPTAKNTDALVATIRPEGTKRLSTGSSLNSAVHDR